MTYSYDGRRAYFCDICGSQICRCDKIIDNEDIRKNMLKAIYLKEQNILGLIILASEETKDKRKIIQIVSIDPTDVAVILTSTVSKVLGIK